MFRKTITILSLIGLLLSCCLWFVSFGFIVYQGPENIVSMDRGVLHWSHVTAPTRPGEFTHTYAFLRWILPHPFPRGRVHDNGAWSFALPTWIPVLFFAVLFWLTPLAKHCPRPARALSLWMYRTWPSKLPNLDAIEPGPRREAVLRSILPSGRVSFLSLIGLVLAWSALLPYLRHRLRFAYLPTPWFVAFAVEGIFYVLVTVCVCGLVNDIRARRRVRQILKEARIVLCRNCGCDLLGSTDRCPECGTTFGA